MRNEEAPFPQAPGTLFKRVLRKKHANFTHPGGIQKPLGIGAVIPGIPL
jgi:hypothetical protein